MTALNSIYKGEFHEGQKMPPMTRRGCLLSTSGWVTCWMTASRTAVTATRMDKGLLDAGIDTFMTAANGGGDDGNAVPVQPV